MLLSKIKKWIKIIVVWIDNHYLTLLQFINLNVIEILFSFSMRCTRVQLSAAQTGLHQWTRSIGVLKAAQEVLLEPRTLFRTSSISSKKGFNVAFFPAKTKSKKKWVLIPQMLKSGDTNLSLRVALLPVSTSTLKSCPA